jgi:hypothetical protein
MDSEKTRAIIESEEEFGIVNMTLQPGVHSLLEFLKSNQIPTGEALFTLFVIC